MSQSGTSLMGLFSVTEHFSRQKKPPLTFRVENFRYGTEGKKKKDKVRERNKEKARGTACEGDE